MNKSFIKMSTRSIKGSLSRFIAIVSIVALGSGFLAGLLATTPDMKESANKYFDEMNLYDFYIQSTLGFSEEDVKAVEELSYVTDVMAIKQEDIMVKDKEEENLETRVFYIDFNDENRLNKFEIIEGKLPENEGECLIEIPNRYNYEASVGDTFTLSDGRDYKVTGIVSSPMFLSNMGETTTIGKGSIALGMYIAADDNTETYTALYGKGNIKSDDTFSDEYKNEADKIKDDLAEFGKTQVNVRYEQLKKEAQNELSENKKAFEEERSGVLSQLDETKSTLSESQRQVNSGIAQIDEATAQIDNSLAQIADGIAAIDEQLSQIEGAFGYEQVYRELQSERKNLLTQRQELTAKKNTLTSQKASLQENLIRINKGWKDYEQGRQEAEERFIEAEAQLNDAQEKIDDMEKGEWYVFNRMDTTGISGYENDVEKVDAIAKIFPVFFFLVAALVVLTTMTRMIEEERGQVGTLKSLGYKNSLIRNYYFVYGVAASLLGSIIGLGVGFVIFPKVIANAYAMLYNTPPVSVRFIWPLALFITAVTLGIILVTIYFACKGELKEKPASLLQPKAPEAGKRILLEKITPVWSRIKFTHKVTLRNLFRYKKRFLMTIIGMAGCFSLLVAGFGVRDSIGDIVGIQYNEIYKYDMTVSVEREQWNPSENIYAEQGFFAEENAKVSTDEGSETLTLTVPESNEAMEEFIDTRTRTDHEKLSVKDGEIILSEKMCEVLDVKPDDIVTLKSDNGKECQIKVSGICENYVGNVGFINEKTYEDSFGKKPSFETLYLNIKDDVKESKDSDSIVRTVMGEENVQYALSTDTIRENFEDSVKNIDYIVIVLIISAGGLSIIVLYNLTNVNICERKKELATIKVLGFYEKEVSSYIFREINILAVIGIVCGIPLGIALHRFVIKTAEVGGMMFGRNIYWQSFLFSVLITLLFTFIVNLIMRRSIRKIDMVESMKAND